MNPLLELVAVLWDEWVLFRKNFLKITISALISPLLYIIAFGYGVSGGSSLSGITYLKFLIPGIIALTTMNGSYKAISVKLITNRVYDQTFEQYLIAPISVFSYCIGKATAGALRGMYAGGLIIGIAVLFDIHLKLTPMFFVLMFLNGFTFASLGMYGAMVAKSHADMNRFGTYVMLPMTFLCGTFFRTEHLPWLFEELVQLLPLTHMTQMLRAIATYQSYYLGSVLIVVLYLVVFFLLAYKKCLKISA